MQQTSTKPSSSPRIQHVNVGAKVPSQKLPVHNVRVNTVPVNTVPVNTVPVNTVPVNKVPGMWRFVVFPNRLPPSSSELDSALHLRFDSAHGIGPRNSELNWSAQVGLPAAFNTSVRGLPIHTQIDCCARTTSPVAPAVTASLAVTAVQPATRADSIAVGERYRAMLAEAAHDIRAPLGVARQILSRIASRVREDGGLSNQDKRLLDSANDRLQQATTWVDGILLPKRLEQVQGGTLRQRFYPHQLKGLVEPIVSQMARNRSVELDWVGWDRSLPRLYLDANQLGRVLLNLISNAIAASPRGKHLRLRIAWQTNVTQRLVIAVEDEGCGLPPALLRFVNSAQPVLPPAEAGIGLNTIKSLMNAIGGSISAQVSALGGTLFRITVPVDNRLSLVRGWLVQQSQPADRNAKDALDTVQLHVLRSSGVDSRLVDQWLQGAAARQEFVYRVSDDRWLWLSIKGKSALAAAMEAVKQCFAMLDHQNGQLNCQLAAEWVNIELQSLHSATNQRNLLPQLAAAIADKFNALAGNRVPPLDELKDSWTPKNKPIARHRDFERVDEVGNRVPKTKLRAAKPERVDLMTADPGILAELAQDWREQHSRL